MSQLEKLQIPPRCNMYLVINNFKTVFIL